MFKAIIIYSIWASSGVPQDAINYQTVVSRLKSLDQCEVVAKSFVTPMHEEIAKGTYKVISSWTCQLMEQKSTTEGLK